MSEFSLLGARLNTILTDIINSLNSKQASGTYNTIIGTDSDLNTANAEVVDQINVTDGVIQSMTKRTLTLANLGYTGADDADNYGGWTIEANGVSESVASGAKIIFEGANGCSVSYDDTLNKVVIDAPNDTWRPISSSPTNGATTTSISSDWAFDNVKKAVPADAKFTDTTYDVGDGGLTQNNFTDTLKSKLDNIASGADNYDSWDVVVGSDSGKVSSGDDLTITGDGTVSVSLDAGTKTLTISGTDTNTDTNYYLSGASFNETNGIVTLSRSGLSNVTVDLDGRYAPLASPALTGTPTAPTASEATNSTQIATTAYVKTAIGNLIDGAPAALDTLKELATALNDDASFSTTFNNAITNIGTFDEIDSSLQYTALSGTLPDIA